MGWTFNTGIVGWLSEYLGTKGINFNLNQFIYGYETVNNVNVSIQDIKLRLYNAMESDDEHKSNPSKFLDKGKGVDRDVHPFYDKDMFSVDEQGKNKSSNKGKEVLQSLVPTEPHMFTWSRIFPGKDPASVFFPKRTNPGPGFNVPGDEVPIRDEICQHIDYNTHILSQFKKMDLETAIEQRNNNLLFIRIIETKLDYAKSALSKVSIVPTTEYEFRLKNQILRDLDSLSRDKIRAEARTTLLNSRIQFIENKMTKN